MHKNTKTVTSHATTVCLLCPEKGGGGGGKKTEKGKRGPGQGKRNTSRKTEGKDGWFKKKKKKYRTRRKRKKKPKLGKKPGKKKGWSRHKTRKKEGHDPSQRKRVMYINQKKGRMFLSTKKRQKHTAFGWKKKSRMSNKKTK